ncbi:hypothetical protein H7J81_18115 [Mycobacterium cookii]|nr:hypothetical protein [Mycobacterium cookii]
MGTDRSKLAEAMHNLDVGSDVLAEFPPCAEVFDQVTGRERCPPAVVDAHAVRRGGRYLVPVERGVTARDDRPRVRVGGRFTGDESGIELGDGGVEVFEVENDDRRNLIVRADFDDGQRIRQELLGPAIVARAARENEALPTGCDHDGRYVHESGVSGRPQICDLGISTVSGACVYNSPAIIDSNVFGQYLRERIPVAGCEVRQVALDRLACCAFQPRCRRAQLVERRDRGVEVSLVEQFGAADHIAFDSKHVDIAPLGIEVFL